MAEVEDIDPQTNLASPEPPPLQASSKSARMAEPAWTDEDKGSLEDPDSFDCHSPSHSAPGPADDSPRFSQDVSTATFQAATQARHNSDATESMCHKSGCCESDGTCGSDDVLLKIAKKPKKSKRRRKAGDPVVEAGEAVTAKVEAEEAVAAKVIEHVADDTVILSIVSEDFPSQSHNFGPDTPCPEKVSSAGSPSRYSWPVLRQTLASLPQPLKVLTLQESQGAEEPESHGSHCKQGRNAQENTHLKDGRVWKLRGALLFCSTSIVLLAVVTLCTSVFSFSIQVNEKNELIGLNGEPVGTDRIESYSTLSDVSGQSWKFLHNMNGISLKVGTDVHHFKISGFVWSNVSYMVIETTRGRDIVVAGGSAFIRDASSGRVLHVTTPASEPHCGRRLVETAKAFVPASYSWNRIVDRYHAETTGVVGGRQWRRLNEGTNELYEWFGALISSNTFEETSKATESMRQEYCSYDTRGLECEAYESSKNPKPPMLSETGFSKFVMMGASDTWLLYLDVSDWARGSMIPLKQRSVRSKMVSGVTRDIEKSTGSAMRVTESQGSWIQTYQMLHPAVAPERYNLTNVSKLPVDVELAETVLESQDYEDFKGECSKTTKFALDRDVDLDEEITPSSTKAPTVTFNCDDGTFTWSIHGWRVQASADGTIQALIFSNASYTAFNEDEDDGQIRFKVLSVTDGGDPRANFKLSQSFEEGTIFTGCTVPRAGEKTRALSTGSIDRQLGAVLPGSNWCGPGQCGENVHGCRNNYCLGSFDGDWACRRHDACAKDSPGIVAGIIACSCDKDLYDNRGTGFNAEVISAIYGPYGLRPCISRESSCRTWGWVKHGRRRRWGWSSWGITGRKKCDEWNYLNKYKRMDVFGYKKQINDYDVHSKQSWPGCYDNTDDFDITDPLKSFTR